MLRQEAEVAISLNRRSAPSQGFRADAWHRMAQMQRKRQDSISVSKSLALLVCLAFRPKGSSSSLASQLDVC